MDMTIICLSVSLSLFLGMMLFEELGRRIGVSRLESDPEGALKGTGVTEGAIFAVWGLLLAFTFSGAGVRMDMRRELVGHEANAIGTAYLRLDLLAPEPRDKLKDLFRQYLDARLEIYRLAPDKIAREEAMDRSVALQNEIWRGAEQASRADDRSSTAILLLPAINEMIDITTTRYVATMMHPPLLVFGLIIVVSLVCSLFAGYSLAAGKRRKRFHLAGFALITAVIVYVILDMEYPRLGLIRVDAVDKVLMDLRANML